MPFNLLKKYPALLELSHLDEKGREKSLQGVFKQDIEENANLNFRNKKIRPIKGEEPEMELTFRHLTTEEIEVEENGKKYKKRIFEMDRSRRIHWLKYHFEENKKDKMQIFSAEERDLKKRQDIIRTYIYDIEQKYVIVLDPQRSNKDYYLVTAYYLNKDYGEKKIGKLLKKKLNELY